MFYLDEPMKVTSFANPLAEVEETPSRKTENGATRITVGEEVLESSEVLIDEENKDSRRE